MVDRERQPGLHRLGAVDQAEPLLRLQHQRFDALLGEQLGGWAPPQIGRPGAPQTALADERQGKVGELGQVTRGTDAALSGDDRQQAAFEEQEQPLRQLDPHPADADRESARAQQEQRPDHVVSEGVAHPCGVGADQGQLHGSEVPRGDAGVGQCPESGGDSVHHPVLGDGSLDDLAGRGHPGGDTGVQSGRSASSRDVDHLIELRASPVTTRGWVTARFRHARHGIPSATAPALG